VAGRFAASAATSFCRGVTRTAQDAAGHRRRRHDANAAGRHHQPRVAFKMNFTPIAGLLADGMTDPPALACANAISRSDAPSIADATVHPLTLLLRIVRVQMLVLVFGA
jgi:hypothetical protein